MFLSFYINNPSPLPMRRERLADNLYIIHRPYKEVQENHLLPVLPKYGRIGVSPNSQVPQRMGDLGGSVIVSPFQGGQQGVT